MFVLRGLSKRRYLGPVFWDLSIRYAESGSESDPRKTNIKHTRPEELITIKEKY